MCKLVTCSNVVKRGSCRFFLALHPMDYVVPPRTTSPSNSWCPFFILGPFFVFLSVFPRIQRVLSLTFFSLLGGALEHPSKEGKASKALCQNGKKVNSVDHRNAKRVSQNTLDIEELNSVVVLSNAQLFERVPPIYNRVCEVPFDIPQGYMKGFLI